MEIFYKRQSICLKIKFRTSIIRCPEFLLKKPFKVFYIYTMPLGTLIVI